MVRFGVHAGPQSCTIEELRALWHTAERLGFEWISIWDHFYPAQVDPADDCFEAVACHAALAAATSRPRVGCLVYSAGYRHPGVLANAGVTVDHLSSGRLEMGLGAGWHEDEYRDYGLPFESPATRLRRLAESVEIVRALWSNDLVDYDGEFFTLREARCNPKPLQAAPRIWIGALGEKLALPLAGRLGDGWNASYVSPSAFARKWSIVRDHSPKPETIEAGVNIALAIDTPDRVGSFDIDEQLRARFGPVGPAIKRATAYGSPSEVAAKVGEYVNAGASWVIIGQRAPFDLPGLERFATEVIPQFR